MLFILRPVIEVFSYDGMNEERKHKNTLDSTSTAHADLILVKKTVKVLMY